MTKTNGSLAWKIFVGVLAVLVVTAIVAEFGLRAYLSRRIETEIAAAVDLPASEHAQVSFGHSPLTFGLLTSKVPELTAAIPSTLALNEDGYTGTPAATVNLRDLRQTDAGAVAESMDLATVVPDSFIQEILQQQMRQALGDTGLSPKLLENFVSVSEVKTNAAAGTISITFTEGVAALDLHPRTENGQATFDVDATRLFGIDLPGGAAEKISEALQEGMRQAVFGNLRVRDITTIEGGLRVTLAGEEVNLDELAGSAQSR
ncbi:DUF2993 domain-containing protein [Corynebacterium liangguodongii]|uniref:Uncharacterized protein n=1 Tax=Corynebacterium liangguodongii TaxID=2079535 RepID=A0A2S0WBW7_9CORY|nr:DUF2993 domain-containing protein [Corynebacterium liangguodongii]AWB83269.1 hypothetical protein C3E79_01195 [Corynebacterium liangguodongii]PWC00641.1 DUF2993 domain-containing protein [Corynebacterium liangguodongii]